MNIDSHTCYDKKMIGFGMEHRYLNISELVLARIFGYMGLSSTNISNIYISLIHCKFDIRIHQAITIFQQLDYIIRSMQSTVLYNFYI